MNSHATPLYVHVYVCHFSNKKSTQDDLVPFSLQKTATAAEMAMEDLRRKLAETESKARELQDSAERMAEFALTRKDEETSRLLGEKDALIEAHLVGEKKRAKLARDEIEDLRQLLEFQDREAHRLREEWRNDRTKMEELLEAGQAEKEAALLGLKVLEKRVVDDDEKVRECLELQNLEADAMRERFEQQRNDEVGKLTQALESQKLEAVQSLGRLQKKMETEAGHLREALGLQESEGVELRTRLEQREREREELRALSELHRAETVDLRGRFEAVDEEARKLRSALASQKSEADAIRERCEDAAAKSEEYRKALEVRGSDADATRERLDQERIEVENDLRGALELKEKEASTAGKQLRALGRYVRLVSRSAGLLFNDL